MFVAQEEEKEETFIQSFRLGPYLRDVRFFQTELHNYSFFVDLINVDLIKRHCTVMKQNVIGQTITLLNAMIFFKS